MSTKLGNEVFRFAAANALLALLVFSNARSAHAVANLAVTSPSLGETTVMSEVCMANFNHIGQSMTLGRSASRDSLLTASVRGRLAPQLETLKFRIRNDLRTPEQAKQTALVQREYLTTVAADLRSQGYVVHFEKRAGGPMPIGLKQNDLPDRDVLYITSGDAKGEFARELRRLETDMALRKADPNIPKIVRDTEFGTSFDPIVSILAENDMHFTSNPVFGAGVTLAPEMLSVSIDEAVFNLRHEIRHSKGYFDLVSGKPTLARAYITNPATREFAEGSTYGHYFSVEEIDAYRSNVLSLQTAIRRRAEALRKTITDAARMKLKPVPAVYTAYRTEIEALQKRGIDYSLSMTSFASSTLEHAARARAKLADPSMSSREFAARIFQSTDPMLPGLKDVAIHLGENPKLPGPEFHIVMPLEVTSKGPEAIREYAIKYCFDIEDHARSRLLELQIRIRDLSRDATSRLNSAQSP